MLIILVFRWLWRQRLYHSGCKLLHNFFDFCFQPSGCGSEIQVTSKWELYKISIKKNISGVATDDLYMLMPEECVYWFRVSYFSKLFCSFVNYWFWESERNESPGSFLYDINSVFRCSFYLWLHVGFCWVQDSRRSCGNWSEVWLLLYFILYYSCSWTDKGP